MDLAPSGQVIRRTVKRMKVSELKEKLITEGCNADNFAVLSRSHDAFCLDKIGNEWTIFYSERGHDSKPIFTTENEQEACEFFYNYVRKQQHWHIVGFFKSEEDAKELEIKLSSIGVNPIRNDIPAYKTVNDPRYRVFVSGKDIFKVIEHFGKIEINDA
jgi:hypothetical protein